MGCEEECEKGWGGRFEQRSNSPTDTAASLAITSQNIIVANTSTVCEPRFTALPANRAYPLIARPTFGVAESESGAIFLIPCLASADGVRIVEVCTCTDQLIIHPYPEGDLLFANVGHCEEEAEAPFDSWYQTLDDGKDCD